MSQKSRFTNLLTRGLQWLFLLACLTFGSAAVAAEKTVLLWGDSLSAGFGVPAEKRWATLLKQRLVENGYTLVNGSISGETTQGGAVRLVKALSLHKPTILMLELGGNDGLRGLPITAMESNLRSMLDQATRDNVSVLILGMKIPPNYGPLYTRQFENTYRKLSQEFNAPLIPFFLEGIATDYDLMQADGIHPNEKAQGKLLENVWPALQSMLEEQERAATVNAQ